MNKKDYFKKQRNTGIAILLLTAILIGLFGGDVIYAFFTVPAGLWLILSNEPIIYGYKKVIDEDEES